MIIIKNNFLKVNKEYFGKGMKANDLLILSQIEELARNGCTCYATDEYFMYITGAGKSAVRAALARLEEKNIIARDTKVVVEHGSANQRRSLYLQKNYQDVILKKDICYVENQHTKDNLIDKEKINLEEQGSSNAMIRPIRYY